MARPTKISTDVIKKLADAIRMGASYAIACKYAGIHYDTFNAWMKTGARASVGLKHDLFTTIQEAEGTAAIGWLAKIEKAANTGIWQAAAWKLERRYPQDYGRTVVSQEHSGKDGGPVVFQVIYGSDSDA